MELAWNFKDLMQFGPKTSVCTWMIDQIVKRNLEFQIHEFSWFASQIWFEIIWICTLAYLDLDYQEIWFITKTIMKVISKAVTQGVTALPLKRNLILRFMKGWEHKNRWRMHRSWRKDDIRRSGRKKTFQSPMQLFLSCVDDISPCRIRLCFMTVLVSRFITRSSWSSNSSGCSEWKRTFSYPNVKGDNPPSGYELPNKIDHGHDQRRYSLGH
jgi:hypothetical protein